MEKEIQVCTEVLNKGGIILYPTDTIWGIGCDATDVDAVEKIYSIKQRVDTKAMLVLADSIEIEVPVRTTLEQPDAGVVLVCLIVVEVEPDHFAQPARWIHYSFQVLLQTTSCLTKMIARYGEDEILFTLEVMVDD